MSWQQLTSLQCTYVWQNFHHLYIPGNFSVFYRTLPTFNKFSGQAIESSKFYFALKVSSPTNDQCSCIVLICCSIQSSSTTQMSAFILNLFYENVKNWKYKNFSYFMHAYFIFLLDFFFDMLNKSVYYWIFEVYLFLH